MSVLQCKTMVGLVFVLLLGMLIIPSLGITEGETENHSIIHIPFSVDDQEPEIRQFSLPASLRIIDEAAFWGTDAVSIRVPDQVIQIGDQAFKNSKRLRKIFIPQTEMEIGSDIFSGNEVVISGYSDSYSRVWAKKNGFRFELNPSFKQFDHTIVMGLLPSGTDAKRYEAIRLRGLVVVTEKETRTGRSFEELKANQYDGISSIYIQSRYFP